MTTSIPVVINADDFGYSTEVNMAIDRALDQRRISSSTLIANAPAAEQAVWMASRHPHASFGIHLNLTEFRPLTNHTTWARSGLLDHHGCFNGKIRNSPPSLRVLRACAQEWEAQCRHLRSLGLYISHLDSHHHVHTIAWLWPALVWLQKRQQLPLCRNTMNVYDPSRPASWKLLTAKQTWQLASRRLAGFLTTDVFTDFDIFWRAPQRRCFREASSIELMCHPGQNGFETQTQRLMGDQLAQLPAPFEMVPFPKACFF